MEVEEIYKVFKQLRNMGVFELTLTGGEIFTRSDIMNIIETARKMGFKVILFTNVSLLTEEIIHQLAELYISEISCTVFSLDEKIHDYITGVKGSLKKTLENIKLIKKYGIALTIKTIITNVNYNEWKRIEEFCEKNGFAYMIDHDVFSQKDGNKKPIELRMTNSQLELELTALDKMREFKIRNHDLNEFVCSGIQNALFIDCIGRVYPCNKFLFQIGDLKKENLRDIWVNSNELRRLQDIKWKDLRQCKKCEKSRFCVHCPGTALLEDGSEYGISTLACEKAEIRAKLYS